MGHLIITTFAVIVAIVATYSLWQDKKHKAKTH